MYIINFEDFSNDKKVKVYKFEIIQHSFWQYIKFFSKGNHGKTVYYIQYQVYMIIIVSKSYLIFNLENLTWRSFLEGLFLKGGGTRPGWKILEVIRYGIVPWSTFSAVKENAIKL